MIIGRAVEQAALSGLLTDLREGAGHLVVVVGEAGLGKTTLLDWAESQAEGVLVLRANGRASEADLPFIALADLLRPLHGRIATLPDPQAKALGSALALSEDAAVDRGAVIAATLTLLTGHDGPLLILIDDYHWLDTASREVVDVVARRAVRLGLGLIVASRDEIPDADAFEIRLDRLSADASSELVRRRGPASRETRRRLLALADGNPLALVELPLDPQALEAEPLTGRPVAISAAVAKAYRFRLDSLPSPTREALLCAAVESSESTTVVWRVLAGLGIDRQALRAAEEADLLTVDEYRYRFRHPLLRSVITQGAGADAVARVHRALAEVVDDEDQRAWYLAAASAGPDEEVATALEEAAKRALSRGAAGTAAAAFERAAALSEAPAGRAARVVAAARAAHKAGNMSATARLLDLARTTGSADDPRLHLLDADIRMRLGDVAGAYGALRLEGAGIADRDPRRAATMLLLATKLRVYRLEAAAALKDVHEAIALVPVAERSALHLASVAMVSVMAGEPDARDSAVSAMEAAVGSPHGHIHTLGIGWPLLWVEEYERARAFVSRSVAIQREGGHLAYLPQALLPMAELQFRTGRWDLARADATEAIALFEETQQPSEAAIASALLARIDASCGDDAEATRHAAAALASDVGSGLRVATAYAEAALGILRLGRGQFREAVPHLDRAQTTIRGGGIGEPWLLPVAADLAEALARTGDVDAAEAQAAELVTAGRAAGRRSAEAAGLRGLGLVADDTTFCSLFEEALLIHGSLPTPFETARTELCYGERLRRTRHRAESRVRLRRSLATFESLGAVPWADRARTELAASGETLRRRSPLTSLTPQERQVAGLVATGATNPEVAAQLFVSRKTVEFHLGNVYRKLGVRSRTELVSALANVAE